MSDIVFAKYLENGWTEFNQISYTHYHWQDPCCYNKASFFANLQQSNSPWLMSEIGFCSISWEWMDRIQPNFVYIWSSTRSILILLSVFFWQMFNRVAALNWCQKLFFAQYLENGWTEFNQILYTLYHIHDLCLFCKLSFFRKFATELRPLIDIRNIFAQYLENGWTEFNQILYTLFHIHDLCLFCKLSFFANLQQSYGPWLMSEIGFCSISW